jgi:CubicO group peptidase (beta-lactamase class C family)
VTSKPWEEVINQRLFIPLGMTSAGFGAPGVAGELIEPRGHLDDGKPAPIGPEGDNPQAMWPCGGVHCSSIDWAKFVAFHLSDGQSHPGLLRAEYFTKMHTPMPIKGDDGYAMGWAVTKRGMDGPQAKLCDSHGLQPCWPRQSRPRRVRRSLWRFDQ